MINVPLVLAYLWLIAKAVPATGRTATDRKVDVIGALLCVLGLGGSVFALIEQPRLAFALRPEHLPPQLRDGEPQMRDQGFKVRSVGTCPRQLGVTRMNELLQCLDIVGQRIIGAHVRNRITCAARA